jgi:membrane protein YdbS with pleckstrin-like domain
VIEAFRFLAVFTGSLFAGAALYINVAEHPARMLMDTRNAALQWAPSYKRATWLQAPLAVVSFCAGAAVWFVGGGVAWLVAAALIGAVVPFTFIGIMPTNHRLLSGSLDLNSHEARELLVRWGYLHAVRTLLSLCAAAIYVWLIVRA